MHIYYLNIIYENKLVCLYYKSLVLYCNYYRACMFSKFLYSCKYKCNYLAIKDICLKKISRIINLPLILVSCGSRGGNRGWDCCPGFFSRTPTTCGGGIIIFALPRASSHFRSVNSRRWSYRYRTYTHSIDGLLYPRACVFFFRSCKRRFDQVDLVRDY